MGIEEAQRSQAGVVDAFDKGAVKGEEMLNESGTGEETLLDKNSREEYEFVRDEIEIFMVCAIE